MMCKFVAMHVVNIVHRRSQGAQWVYLHPQGGEKNQAYFTGKIVSAPRSTPSAPPGGARVNFRTYFAVWGRFGASVSSFRPSLKATTKKGRQFFRKKCTPRQNLDYAYDILFLYSILCFLPRCMECRRGLAMRILSVRLSVCLSVRPSVCQTRGL